MAGEVLGFSEDDAKRIAATVRANEQMPVYDQRFFRRAYSRPGGQFEAWVKPTSTTATAGRYPATIWTYDDTTQAWTDTTFPAYFEDPNGVTPSLQRYRCVQVGQFQGASDHAPLPVFQPMASTSSGGGGLGDGGGGGVGGDMPLEAYRNANGYLPADAQSRFANGSFTAARPVNIIGLHEVQFPGAFQIAGSIVSEDAGLGQVIPINVLFALPLANIRQCSLSALGTIAEGGQGGIQPQLVNAFVGIYGNVSPTYLYPSTLLASTGAINGVGTAGFAIPATTLIQGGQRYFCGNQLTFQLQAETLYWFVYLRTFPLDAYLGYMASCNLYPLLGIVNYAERQGGGSLDTEFWSGAGFFNMGVNTPPRTDRAGTWLALPSPAWPKGDPATANGVSGFIPTTGDASTGFTSPLNVPAIAYTISG
jgi:hypothetical protein